MKMRRIKTSVKRYQLENDFILEVWKEENETSGLYYEFWIAKEHYGEKFYMFGIPAQNYQDNKPIVYSEKDCLEIAIANLEEYIEDFKNEIIE